MRPGSSAEISVLRTNRDSQLLLSTVTSLIASPRTLLNGRYETHHSSDLVLPSSVSMSFMNMSHELMHVLTIENDSILPDAVENLTELYGPKRDPLYVVIPITVFYLLIFLTGVIGNISTCIVISRNRSMHTATNYYLFSLAISDFLLLVSGVPQEIYFIWSKYPYVFGETFCVLRGIAAETSANATVLTITAFTVERYVAICHPFLSHTMSKLSRAIRFIFVIWLIAILSAVPQALQFGVTNQGGIDQCVVKRIIIQHSFELSTFLFFFAPMTLITVLYALIGLKLRSSTLMQRDGTLQRRNHFMPSSRQSSANSQGTRRVLKMLVAVVVAFFLCWAPFHAQRLVYIYGVDKDHQPSDPLILKLFVVTTYISGILYYLSTCINPLLYNIMSNKFRQAFKETLSNCCQIARQSNSAQRSYRILPRRERRSAANKESSDISGNSIKDESLYSCSTQKQSFDSITLIRGQSLKRTSSTTVIGAQESVLSMPIAYTALYHNCHQPHAHVLQNNYHHGQEHVFISPSYWQRPTYNVLPSSKPGRPELDLYTQERELQLNINTSSIDSRSTGCLNGSEDSEQLADRILKRVSIQFNPISTGNRAGLKTEFSDMHIMARGKRLSERSDTLWLLCKQPRGQDGRIEIFVRNRQRKQQRSRLRLWRFFQHMRPLRQTPGTSIGRQKFTSSSGTVVRFYDGPSTDAPSLAEDQLLDNEVATVAVDGKHIVGAENKICENHFILDDVLEAY
ncbi:pyrokinin-1 receptor isoform X1 [Anopheles funestus]|uniref:G-protein coupled receptors family 1 profile domain-containing protein n=1 Tax=Anopheles funestus TaxID=62324 RepID=A0A182RPJ3_ANOFN|nr:pyrokinin-1 receptor isoform X1 [Anopheles funestus]XP_049279764.1 pyrokinin-1 receptor isoform X1 [Anopheles funestus]XP_049279772.1 pyrokinin-1 receptor isoform X1 [Anopheles funestus]XP_049279781.1 pyrokinin-1 receptor isoform X1 [Anopheles funestus]XP_049279789.1 pyrokinin-1 receptor isoform X1 [Anopheles funestus]XP_049279797.1 pyrokinin-1 receptor isoform X1 [Anopheles funestus]XP_049279805.1 pyrokinin-1 receptor isoform X1 [Anopheles funestus]XP_049279809.1 pyrokinin-1 receptor iso